jgi:hypothetical protein
MVVDECGWNEFAKNSIPKGVFFCQVSFHQYLAVINEKRRLNTSKHLTDEEIFAIDKPSRPMGYAHPGSRSGLAFSFPSLRSSPYRSPVRCLKPEFRICACCLFYMVSGVRPMFNAGISPDTGRSEIGL